MAGAGAHSPDSDTAIYVPFTTQELFQPGGLYEGTNARSKNLIMVNRKLLPAPAGMVLGMTGFGKSFAVMQMMAGIMLRWPEDDLVIIDPENEYARLVEAFGGEVIEISASSKSHINPMDISEDYGDEGNPIQLKSQFLRDFCQWFEQQRAERPRVQSCGPRSADYIPEIFAASGA